MIQSFKPFRWTGQAAMLSLMLNAMPALSAQAEDGLHPARAVITIPTPRSANLLQLRGMGGRGIALVALGTTCHRLPVRLVAGDFEGQQTNMRDGEPVVLEIRDAALVQALLNGADIVSDGASVSGDPTDAGADILLVSGLNEGTGFVINPGRNLVSDVLGMRVTDISCEAFDRAVPEG
ncbi:MAG: hypothetical protein AAF679_09380 [Pseudomonadota bacterium]